MTGVQTRGLPTSARPGAPRPSLPPVHPPPALILPGSRTGDRVMQQRAERQLTGEAKHRKQVASRRGLWRMLGLPIHVRSALEPEVQPDAWMGVFRMPALTSPCRAGSSLPGGISKMQTHVAFYTPLRSCSLLTGCSWTLVCVSGSTAFLFIIKNWHID